MYDLLGYGAVAVASAGAVYLFKSANRIGEDTEIFSGEKLEEYIDKECELCQTGKTTYSAIILMRAAKHDDSPEDRKLFASKGIDKLKDVFPATRDVIGKTKYDEGLIIVNGIADDDMSALRNAEAIATKAHRALENELGIPLYAASLVVPLNARNHSEVLSRLDEVVKGMKSSASTDTQERVSSYSKMKTQMHEKEVLDAVKTAIENHLFHPNYVIIKDFKTDKIIGCEALARIATPDGSFAVYPAQFIPALEALDQTEVVDLEMLKRSASLAGKILQGRDTFMFEVNISPQTIRKKGIAEKVLEIIREAQEQGAIFTLDLPASALEDLDVQDSVETLARHGVKFAIEDFGEEALRLDKLMEHENFHAINISRSIIKKLPATGAKNTIRSLAKVAEGLGVSLHVEGIESGSEAEQLKDLLDINGDVYYQGYWISHPMTEELLIRNVIMESASVA